MSNAGQPKGTNPTGKNKAVNSAPPRTLMQAHVALVGVRPKGKASLATWKAFYERSVALYQEIAEIDRGHHHEALYWADREQEKLDDTIVRISAQESPHTPRTGHEGRTE